MTGSRPITTATLIIAWPTIQHMIAPVVIRAIGSACRRITRTIAKASSANSTSTRRVPMSPSSSPMIAKMKSLWAAGR